MRTKTLFTITSLVLTLSLLAASCNLLGGSRRPPLKPVNLLIWKVFEDDQAFGEVISEYQRSHSNVRITFEKKDIATYEQDLLHALASGSGPDIFSIHNDWVPRYKDKIVPAPEKLFTPREFQETFLDIVREDFVGPDGKLYALPMSIDVLSLYYNRDLLGSAKIVQPPKTWQEVIEVVKKLSKQDKFGNFLVNGIAMGAAGNINRSTDILSLLMLQNGTQVYNANRTQATLDRDATAPDGKRYTPGPQALEFYTQFADPAKETYTWNARNNYSIDAFVAGRVGLLLGYSYLIPTIRSKNPLLQFGIAPAPQTDRNRTSINFGNYFGEAVSKVSPTQEAAWDFLKFATSAEVLRKYNAARKTVSPRRDIISTQIGDSDIGVFAEAAPQAKTFYKPDAPRVEAIFAAMIDDVVLRESTPQQAVAKANQLLNDLLRQ